MKIGFIGLGKLGLPTAITIAYKGHQVVGYDINPDRFTYKLDTYEAGPLGTGTIDELVSPHLSLSFTSNLEECIKHGDIIFVAIQTPHERKYEGDVRIPNDRRDFNYDYLINSIKTISQVLDSIQEYKTIVIISTVLPGTIRERIFPVMSKYINLCYNPYFIAMGTVVQDFLHPEFILMGHVSDSGTKQLLDFYKTITDSPVYETSLENAEMIKVSYNTFIGTKICMANTIMELCDKLPGTNCDQVMNALFMANERLISTKYLRGGMGDGGGCHPRDNIALSWLAKKLDVSFDYYEAIMQGREHQTEFLVDIIDKYVGDNPLLPVYLLGKAFKPNTNICTGSPAILLSHILEERRIKFTHYDPYIDDVITMEKGIYFIATQHDKFTEYTFPDDSIVIDPFRYLKLDNCRVHSVGINNIKNIKSI